MRIVGIVAAAIAAFLAPCVPAHATTYSVNSTADAVDQTLGDNVCATATGTCTLRAAVQEANAHPGADSIALPAGTFVLGHIGTGEDLAVTGDLDVTEELEVHGAGKDATVVDGFNADRIFQVNGVTFTVRDLTLQHGAAGAAPGGAVFQAGVAAAITIERVAFSLNSAMAGAAVTQVAGPLTITDSSFDNNFAPSGSGGALVIVGTGALSVTNSTFTDNSAGAGTGGAIIIASTGTANVQGCTFSGNVAGTGASLLSTGARSPSPTRPSSRTSPAPSAPGPSIRARQP